MADKGGDTVISVIRDHADAKNLIGRLFDVANPGAVFSKPVEVGDWAVITASEVTVTMGFGLGLGGENVDDGPEAHEAREGGSADDTGIGGGIGGGGFSAGRPVAVISVGPDCVRVEPVVDVTKIALAFFTMFGGMVAVMARSSRFARRAKAMR